MTPNVNNMADEEKQTPSMETDNTSQTDQVQEQLIKTAHEQVTQAMSKAMAELPSRLSPQKEIAREPDEKPAHVAEISESPKPPEPTVDKTTQVTTAVEDVDYVEPMQDPYGRAIKYLEQHNVLQMFQQLTASIVYYKPEKPLDFMMVEVEKMKKIRDEEKQKTS